MVGAVNRIGAFGTELGRDLWGMFGLLYDTVAAFVELDKKRYAAATRQFITQILFTGVEALWLVSTIALLCGVTIVIQAMTNMPKFGVGDYFGKILVVILVRELGPLLTSIVVIGRSGSALTTYIASMKVSKEVAALRVMGIDPVQFIVQPAFVGMVVSMVALSAYFDIVGILGGLFVAMATSHIPFHIFVQKVGAALTWYEVFFSIVKVVAFGMIIGIVSCYHGLSAENPREVPRATRKSVVGSIVAAMVFNVMVTVFVYMVLPSIQKG